MSKLLLRGYNDALEAKPIMSINGQDKEPNILYDYFKEHVIDGLKDKFTDIEETLEEYDPQKLVILSTLVLPSLLVTSKSKETKYNARHVRERNLICNNESWIKQLYTYGLTVTEDNADEIKEKYVKHISKLNKQIGKIGSNIQNEEVSGLVLKKTHSNFNLVAKRTPFSLSGYFECFPLLYLWGYSLGLVKLAKYRLLKIVYYKLDGSKRTHYYTRDYNIKKKIYGNALISEEYENDSSNPFHGELLRNPFTLELLDGLLKIPDVQLPLESEYSTSRKISLFTIEQIVDVTNDDILIEKLKNIVKIDLEKVVVRAQAYIDNLEPDAKEELIKTFNLDTEVSIQEALSVKDSIETTTFRVSLHEYMVARQEVFSGYTGEFSKSDYSDNTVTVSSLYVDSELDELDF